MAIFIHLSNNCQENKRDSLMFRTYKRNKYNEIWILFLILYRYPFFLSSETFISYI